MSRPLAIVRPQPGWSRTANAASKLGISVIGHPLFEAEAVRWSPPEGTCDALLVGSAAVFRHGGSALEEMRGLPVLAVGATTARAAQEAGFAVAMTGSGGLQALLDEAQDRWPRLLRLSGEERVRLVPAQGQSIVERTVYRMKGLPIEAGFASELMALRPVVALHSGAAASRFAQECKRLDIARSALELLVLGPRIASSAGLGWAAIHKVETPNDRALIGKAAALCQ